MIYLTIAIVLLMTALALIAQHKRGFEGGTYEAIGCMALAGVLVTAWLVYGLCKWGVL